MVATAGPGWFGFAINLRRLGFKMHNKVSQNHSAWCRWMGASSGRSARLISRL